MSGPGPSAEAGHVEPLLDRYRTGELSAAETERVEAHLAACPRCSGAWADLAAFSATVARGYAAGRAAMEPSAPNWAAQRAAIVARTSAAPKPAPRWVRWLPQVAVGVVAVVAVGVLLEQGVRGPEDAGRIGGGGEVATAPSSAPAADRAADRADDGASEAEELAMESDEDGPRRIEATPLAAPGETFEDDAALAESAAEVLERADTPPPASADAVQKNEPAAQARDLESRARGEAAGAAAPRAAVLEAVPTALDRFRFNARQALAGRDAAGAGRALALWRDSLAAADLAPADRREGKALADSLGALLAE